MKMGYLKMKMAPLKMKMRGVFTVVYRSLEKLYQRWCGLPENEAVALSDYYLKMSFRPSEVRGEIP